ncbi:hypothetical protein [Garciella nitratireducens]|uniref:Uncharacterized protein n=1 Tax=Garciella nitratireducens DSM 15102 TaxID=1121911 RepID=A0A1T4N438_9FIRM|nr:hypothetical protein [Garciella nitratireducens]SJZ74130.1 hypothetical protein SAMN02745973_01555 [Garciella nitratireducens DSM 15102]
MKKLIGFFDAINEDYLKTVGKYGLFRISFYTWYVIVKWGRLSSKLEKYLGQAENILIDAFKIATEKYLNDGDYLWLYGYLISVFPEHFLSVYSDYLKAEYTGKQMLNVASQMQYTLAIIFNEKFLEKDVLENGKKDLENMLDKSTEAYDYFIRRIQ